MVGAAQRDRQKIVEFYASEASIFIADEAFLAIQAAAEQTRKSPLLYREGKRAGTREHVMRRFPYIIVFKVEPARSLSCGSCIRRCDISPERGEDQVVPVDHFRLIDVAEQGFDFR